MKRQLPVLLSVLLSVASAALWVRSTYVDDVWVFEPRNMSGWYYHCVAESAGGRLVLVSRREYFPDKFAPVPGRQPSPVPFNLLDKATYVRNQAGGATEFQLPGELLEWASTSRLTYVAVSWELFAFLFVVPAAVRVIRRAWMRHRNRVPAFPVVASGADKGTGVPALSVSQTRAEVEIVGES